MGLKLIALDDNNSSKEEQKISFEQLTPCESIGVDIQNEYEIQINHSC